MFLNSPSEIKEAEMVQISSLGVGINYVDRGQGEPVLLFMPGWCTSCRVFDRVAAPCAARRRILTLDWPGHGMSEMPVSDFGSAELVEHALSVIRASGARMIVPVALSHAGWLAIELRRRLGGRIPGIVFLDWIILDPPLPFLEALRGLRDQSRWKETRDRLFAAWFSGLDIPEVDRFLHDDMGSYDFTMWARAAREIGAAYDREGNPLKSLAALETPPPVLHLYSQPDDPGYLAAQQTFAAGHPWFHVRRLNARSHFPMFEVPDDVAAAIEQFAV